MCFPPNVNKTDACRIGKIVRGPLEVAKTSSLFGAGCERADVAAAGAVDAGAVGAAGCGCETSCREQLAMSPIASQNWQVLMLDMAGV